MTRPLLVRLAHFAATRYRTVFVVFAGLILLSIAALTRLTLETDVLKLLPRDEPVVSRFVETLERFGNIDYLLVGLRIPEGAVVAPYQTYADELAGKLEGFPEIDRIEYRLASVDELFRQFADKAVLFLPEDDRRLLEAKVSDEGIEDRVREVRRLLGTPQGMAMRDLLVLDPFGLAEIFLGRLGSSQGELAIDWQSGYYLSRDHTMLLLLVEPTEPPQDVDFGKLLVAKIEQAAAEVTAQWPRITGATEEVEAEAATADGMLDAEAPPPPGLALGGAYLTAVDEARFITRDVIINIVTSLVLVLSLFLLAFRRFGPLLYAVVPLASGLILTFGFAAVTLGSLSVATSGTAALLIGLGIDFIIVSYGRFVEERQAGRSLQDAIAAMAANSSRAVVVGAVTTAATFYAFLVTDFRGLWEMGFLTGTGILFCMVSVILLLPALFAWHEKRHADQETEPNFYLHGFGTDALIRASFRHPKVVLGLGVVLTACFAFTAMDLRFESDMMKLRPEGNRGIEVAEEIGETFGSGFNHMMLLVHGDSADEVLHRTAEAARAARELVDQEILYRVDSVASLIPSPQRQQEVLAWLAEERDDALDLGRIGATFHRALAEEGLRARAFEPGLGLFANAVSPQEPLGIDDYRQSGETRQLLDRYVQEVGDGWQSVVYLFPPENRYRREPPPEAQALADELGPHVVLTGNNTINEWARVRIKRDAWIAGILGFVLVGILIWFDFRRVRDTLGALTPLLVGIVWMLGIMGLFGIDLNFMNIFVTTMIIGIGVDYGLHILHRYRETEALGTGELTRGTLETGKAILVAALSTICGFGSMSLSHYPGLRTTGYVAILGALATALVSITLLPAWFAVRREWKARRGRG